ncbi:RNA polymerase sigma factor [Streptomyces spinoverrucosus]|uniref:RNA polymerase sigma factor n=1 Tax=Streptomyces spinoverrucosus TaxID=284043 RepID=UPI00114232D2
MACGGVSRLPERQARALRLRAEDLTVGQVAERLEVSYRTAESLLARARCTLKAVLASAPGLVVAWRRWAADAARLAPTSPPLVAAAALAVVVVISPMKPSADPERPPEVRVLPAEIRGESDSDRAPSTSASLVGPAVPVSAGPPEVTAVPDERPASLGATASMRSPRTGAGSPAVPLDVPALPAVAVEAVPAPDLHVSTPSVPARLGSDDAACAFDAGGPTPPPLPTPVTGCQEDS